MQASPFLHAGGSIPPTHTHAGTHAHTRGDSPHTQAVCGTTCTLPSPPPTHPRHPQGAPSPTQSVRTAAFFGFKWFRSSVAAFFGLKRKCSCWTMRWVWLRQAPPTPHCRGLKSRLGRDRVQRVLVVPCDLSVSKLLGALGACGVSRCVSAGPWVGIGSGRVVLGCWFGLGGARFLGRRLCRCLRGRR